MRFWPGGGTCQLPDSRRRLRALDWAVLAALRGYKILLSPLFAGSCRFVPSCADYAAEAIRLHGLAVGGALAARRLLHCHPLCASGFDPVPQPGAGLPGGSVES